MNSRRYNSMEVRTTVHIVSAAAFAAALIVHAPSAYGTPKPIELSFQSVDPDPACVGCTVDVKVHACDPERDCDPDTPGHQGQDNKVKLEWNFGEGWSSPELVECGDTTKGHPFSTPGTNVISVKATDAGEDGLDCGEPDGPKGPIIQTIQVYQIVRILINGQESEVEVEEGNSAVVTVEIEGSPSGSFLKYTFWRKNPDTHEWVEKHSAVAGTSYTYTPDEIGKYKVVVEPAAKPCGACKKELGFLYGLSCKCESLGPSKEIRCFSSCGPTGDKWPIIGDENNEEDCAAAIPTGEPLTDNCENTLFLECAASPWHPGSIQFLLWYNNDHQVGCCPWTGGLNEGRYYYNATGDRIMKIVWRSDEPGTNCFVKHITSNTCTDPLVVNVYCIPDPELHCNNAEERAYCGPCTETYYPP
jgi:hypothetical protein